MMSKLKSLFSKSGISTEELKDILFALRSLTNDEQNELFVFLSSHPEWVKKISVNLIQKKKAVSSKSVILWDRIIKQELKDLENIDAVT